MDTHLCIASKRDTRAYASTALPDDAVDRILEAGRLAGSAMNRQQRRFVVLESASARQAVARAVTRPGNIDGASLAVAIVTAGSSWSGFDAARAAQNMMLAASADGIASCPNAPKDRERLAEALDLGAEEDVAAIISFGYPARMRPPESRSVEEWRERADRLPLAELVRRI